jgi:excisionase family DNA binding protein
VISGTVLEGLLASLATAGDDPKRELAEHLRPYLTAGADRLLDVSEKAEQLRLHPDTVVKMARQGRLPAIKVGREWRFRADASTAPPSAVSRLSSPAPRRPSRSRTREGVPSSVAAIRGR